MDNITCSTCGFWRREKESDKGDCLRLSGSWIDISGHSYLTQEEVYPDEDVTGVVCFPLCVHDGAGFTYQTKDWFCCIHHPLFKKLT